MLTRRMNQAWIAIVALAVLPSSAGAQERLRVTSGGVSVLCRLTVGGSFEATTKALTGEVVITPEDVQLLRGEFRVDLQKLQTGIGLRDRHLKDKYLEVERGQEFASARVHDIRVERLGGKTTFRGVMTLHGESREISGTAHIEPDGKGYRTEATFPLRISDFRIQDPTYLGVGVKDEVVVRVRLTAATGAVVETLTR